MRRKLTIPMITILCLCLASVSILFKIIIGNENLESTKQYLRNNNLMAINLLKVQNKETIPTFFKDSYINLDIRMTYIDGSGKVIQDSTVDSETLGNHNDREEVIAARKYGEGFSVRYSDTLGKKLVYFASDTGNGYIIRSSMPIEMLNNVENRFFKFFMIIIVIVFLFSMILLSKLSSRIIEPVEELTKSTSNFAKGDFNSRVMVKSSDEIGQLEQTFNHMADKLQNTISDALDKQERLEAILKSMDSGVIAVDKNNKVIMINPYAEKIFGISKEIVGRNLLDHIRNYELDKILRDINNHYWEIKLIWPKERELRIRTADIIREGEILGTVAVIQDITDIKKLENMRSQFVTNVTHELKTPLTSIKGFAETLRYVEDGVQRDKFLDIINDEAERLTRLINDILELSDIENRKEGKKTNIAVKEVAEDVYHLMQQSAESKSIELKYSLGEPVNIYGDEDRFKQMLINLVDNAIKYSDPGGRVEIGTDIKDNKLIVWVKDNGVGIPKQHIDRIFERFYRMDKARSRSQGGTGLGLAIVKHIVISFNGEIKVNSEVGKGSVFTVEIPLV